MKKILILFLFIYTSSALNAKALEIIYPKQNPVNINAKSTFFIGNTKPNSNLTINNQPVKVWNDGSFVQVVPLNEGENLFKIQSKLETATDEINFVVKRNTASAQGAPKEPYQAFETGFFLCSATVKDETPLRSAPNEDAARITHLSKGTILMLEGKCGNFYKVNMGNTVEAWVNEKNVQAYCNTTDRIKAAICETKFDEDKNFSYLKLKLNKQIPYKVTENNTNLEISLYGTEADQNFTECFNSQKVFKQIKIKQNENYNLTIEIPSTERLWGYDCYYKNDEFIFKKRKTPFINTKKPLDDLIIAIDAGHGGSEYGAIGPTGIKEKDINLDIAKKVERELKNSGAKVVMTRTEDKDVGLFDRVSIAKDSNAIILVSLHANALADGGDPYKKRGTATFYYNQQAKELASSVKKQLLKDLGTNDDGTSKGSFVVTRTTTPLAVLIEVAYIIHPEEYQMLLNEDFRQKVAESIKAGLENYLLETTLPSATPKN